MKYTVFSVSANDLVPRNSTDAIISLDTGVCDTIIYELFTIYEKRNFYFEDFHTIVDQCTEHMNRGEGDPLGVLFADRILQMFLDVGYLKAIGGTEYAITAKGEVKYIEVHVGRIMGNPGC